MAPFNDQTVPSATRRGHPLRLLQDDEIKAASAILRRSIEKADQSRGTTTKVHFKNVSLHDPPKALLLPHLDAEASGVASEQRPYVPRCVDIIWSSDNQRNVVESTISLDTGTVVNEIHAGKGQHGPNDRSVDTQINPDKILTRILDTKSDKPRKPFSTTPKSSQQSKSSSFPTTS